jgi:hypothetical protein
VNPVTGEEKEHDDDSSFAELEKSVGSRNKRQKTDDDLDMGWL